MKIYSWSSINDMCQLLITIMHSVKSTATFSVSAMAISWAVLNVISVVLVKGKLKELLNRFRLGNF